MNSVNLIGRICHTPELKYTQTNTPVMSFSLAVDRRYSSEGKLTDFFTVVAWKHTAEFISRNFSKGQMIAITGHLEVRKWEDKKGNKRSDTEVVTDQADFCGDRKNQEGSEKSNIPAPASASGFTDLGDEDDGDLPF